MSGVWGRLEGHAVNGTFPLLRHLGGSPHSVVFLTESEKHGRKELALKLVPAVPALAQLQLARWRAASALLHPALIRIFDAGHCQIGDRHFLYVVSDYADQNLAQLLERRALTEGETREMLAPVLEALSFLHERKCVQARLKPSNVLVVGDQLRLAADTVRPVSETSRASNVASAYEPPEARDGIRTAASDVWALGVTICEALTRQQPSGLHSGELALPSALPSAFRGIVTRCLSRRAPDRPAVKELQVWARGAQLVASLSASGSHRAIAVAPASEDRMEVVEDPPRPEDERPRVAVQSARSSETYNGPTPGAHLALAVILGAVALFVMGWAVIRSLDRPPPPLPDEIAEGTRAPAPARAPTVSELPQTQISANRS